MSSEKVDLMLQYSGKIKCEDASEGGVEFVKLEPGLEVKLENVAVPYKLVLNDENDLLNIKHEDVRNLTQCDISTKTFENILSCIQCNFKATNENELQTHFSVHAKTNNLFQNQTYGKQVPYLTCATGTASYECFHCEYKTCKKAYLRVHLLKHSHNKKYECGKCEYKTANKKLLKCHLLNHSNIKKYECEKCEYKTNSKWGFSSHLLKHSDIKRYQCEKCEYKTARKHDFNIHLLSKHSEINKYQCEKCEYKTARKSHLNSHLLKHSAIKKYQCDKCEYKSARQSNFSVHLLKHSDIKKYRCDQCNFKTVYKYHLNLHLVKHAVEKSNVITEYTTVNKRHLMH